MESKIERIYKLVNEYALISKLPNKTKTDVAIKIVEMDTIMKRLLDLYLNSQSQPEERMTLEQIRGEFDKKRIKEWDKTAMETYKQATQDTPEEWEKEFKFLYGHLYIQNEDGEFCKINGETEDMIDFIKQLLENKEMHAYSDGYTDGITRCMDSLDKLNNKKK